jgi:MBG domain (YGX type)/PASTA domain/Abnormal spindle-like microcephaly-assoc'd, ASPM-SPD-2-Hydin
MRLARFQQHLIAALCGVGFATLFPQSSSAQQINYGDFNTAAAASPSQSSTNCGSIAGGPAASNILFCFNYGGDGLSYVQDFYPPFIDPNANSDSDAGSTNYALQLTANAQSETSSMWFSIPQDVLDGFSAWYAVKINHTPNDPNNYFTADGLAFVIQNAAGGGTDSITNCSETGSGLTVLGGGGGGIGYCGIDNSVALEMDTFWDDPYDPHDPGQPWMYNDNHLALQSCGPGNPNSVAHLTTSNCLITLNGASTLISDPNTSAAPPATASAVTLADGNPHQIVIVYNGPNDSPANTIYVYLDPAYNPGTHTPAAGSVPLFSGPFDITKYINLNNGTAYVGFTAANGGDWEQHELMGFTFTSHGYGKVNVCPPGQTTPAPCSSIIPVTFNFTQDTAINSVQVVTQGTIGLDFTQANGGNCAGTITAGNSCTVNVKFAPLAPGLRLGAVNLLDSGGNVLATKLVYGIGQGPAAAFPPGTQTTVNTGSYSLVTPAGAAVDAAGDLYISDNGHQRVVKVAANGTVTTVGSGLQYPQGLAVDGAGDLFIADNNLNQVVEVTPGGAQTNMSFGLVAQLGVAVDGAGDLFVSDFTESKVVEAPPGCTSSACVTVVYSAEPGFHPVGLAVDAAGDLFIADFSDSPTTTPGKIVEIPAGCTNSGCRTTVGSGWYEPEALAVDAAGDLFVADEAPKIVEVPAGCTSSACQITVTGILAYGLAVDGKGNLFLPDLNGNRVVVANRSQPPSLNFASTYVGGTSTDSPQSVTIQNIGNQALDAISSGLVVNGPNFAEVGGPGTPADCLVTFALTPGEACNLSISFLPQSSGSLASTAVFTDNALNGAPSTQTVALSGVGLQTVPVTVAVPNVVGQSQDAAASSIASAGLTLGTVSTAFSSTVPSGSVISQNPAAGTQATAGSAVEVLVSTGQQPTSNPLSLQNNYFVTGDYASSGVNLRGTGQGGMATGTITISNGQGSQGVPNGADIIAASLYWETLENTPTASGSSGTFDKYPITGQQIGIDLPYTDGALSGTLRVYRADVNTYFAAQANGVRYASGTHTVSLPDGGGAVLPLTEGASLVVIYRVLSPNFPLKSVVIYDGSAIPTGSTTQAVQGFYDAVGGANGTGAVTNLFAAPGSGWNNSSSSVQLGQANQFTATLNPGNAYAAVIVSTPVNNSDHDGILDAWKAGPGAGDFHAGQPGYYDVKSGAWVSLPGAKQGEKDLFVQLDYMCGAVKPDGSCSGENLFPSPDANGNDPLAMVQQAFANSGVQLHLQIGNAVPEDTCSDSNQSQLCQFPNEPGVIGWKNSLEFSKLWPRNLASCASGGDCTARFPYGQKDSYHYVLFGHSLAIPAWNTRYGTLTSIQVSSGVTTIGTADRGTGINACPSRITISGVLGNPSLNGVYNTTGCSDSKTISVATPGVPNWSYPNNTLPEPVIGLTSGTVTSISGYSDLGGADSAVTLGLWLTAPNQEMSKRANVIAGTLFHEIGHTLGLSHGGLYYDTPNSYVPTFEANCKPNYQSSMNYLFQLDGVGPNQAVAYSNQTLVTLNESTPVTQLTDSLGNAATFPTSAWYIPFTTGTLASPATRHCDGTPLNSDSAYRVDAPIAPINPSWSIGQDINFDGQLNTQMRGYNDTANIDLRQVGATGGEFASLANVLSFGSSAAPLNIGAGGNVTLGSGGTVALGSGGTVTLGSGGNVTLGSGGTITLGSGGNVTLGSGGNVTLGSGGTITPGSSGTVTLSIGGNVTLGSGGTITLGSGGNVTLGSGGNVTLGSGGTVTPTGGTPIVIAAGGSYTFGSGGGTVALGSGGNVTLGSGGNVTLGSGGTIALGSGGNVTLGSGGNVTLGSGGTIALGSGGNVTLGSGGNVTLGSGGTVTLGSGGNLSGSGGNVTLGSGGNVTLGSGGTVTLGSGGNVTLGSGGNVTLGSGGTIALGSGGNVTLGSGGTVTLGSGGTVTPSGGTPIVIAAGGSYTFGSSGGTVALGSGGNVTLGSGGNVTLGSGGTITLGSGGTVTLGSGGNVTLGSGGVVTLGSGGNVTLGSGGTVALGSGGNVTLGSGGTLSTELTYETANSVVRAPSSPTETPTGTSVRVDWNAPAFGVVQTYTIYRSSNGAAPIAIGSVSGNPPATEFIDTNPDLISQTVVYTITTTLAPVTLDPTQRQSPPSPPAVLKNDQTITLGPLPSSVLISGPQPTVTATALSSGVANGLQVSFSATGACSIGSQSIASGVSSASVVLNSAGSCTITASQPGTNAFNAANAVSGTFMILPQGSNLMSQTITFAPLQNAQYGNTFSLSASSTSGLTVSFTASGPCTASGSITGVGLCKITASAQGNSTYSATSVTQSFTIYPAVLKVTADNLVSMYGQPLPSLTYKYSGFVNSEPASVVSGIPALSTTATTGSNPGGYPITVSTGTLSAANYSFLYVNGTLTIQPASQTITFTANPPATAAYNTSFTVAATGGASGLPVTFTSSGACSNVGATYKMTSGTGTCAVIANQAGNSNYAAAPQVTKTVNATLVAQTITFTTNPPASAAYNTSFTVVATGGASGLPVTFTSSGACSNTGATYKMTSGTGTCSVIANQAGNSNYAAAPQVTTNVNATLVAQTITFTTNPPASAAFNTSFKVAATGGASGLPVAFTSSGVCTNSGATYTMTNSTGTCSVIANQAGNTNYAAAPQVTKTVSATGPLVTVSPSNIDFGTVYLGATTTRNITVTNIGTAPVVINQPLISIVKGGNSNQFVAVNLCLTPLAAGKSCTITIAFVAGAFYTQQTATLQIMDNAPGSPQPVTLSAMVINPLASFSPTSLSFGTIKHATSSTLNVTFSNTGATPLNFTGISVTGANAANFVQSNTCGSSLAAGAKCTLAVKFTPPATGTFSAALTVVDNAQAGGGTQTVPLSGKGN